MKKIVLPIILAVSLSACSTGGQRDWLKTGALVIGAALVASKINSDATHHSPDYGPSWPRTVEFNVDGCNGELVKEPGYVNSYEEYDAAYRSAQDRVTARCPRQAPQPPRMMTPEPMPQPQVDYEELRIQQIRDCQGRVNAEYSARGTLGSAYYDLAYRNCGTI